MWDKDGGPESGKLLTCRPECKSTKCKWGIASKQADYSSGGGCRKEAERDAAKEPLLKSFMNASILTHGNFQECLAFVLANRMSNPTMPDIDYGGCFLNIFNESDEIVQAALDDLQAVRERVGVSLYDTAISGNVGLTSISLSC